MKHIVCLTGPQDNIHAMQRVEGYLEAMHAHGIRPDKSWIVYGDFWISSAKALAEKIKSGFFPMPQAFVCANDYMAFRLCLSLNKAGVAVPYDVVVGGYDANPDIEHFSPLLTTVIRAPQEAAEMAVYLLHETVQKA